MDKASDFVFNRFQMEWERSRDIDDKAKFISMVSAILIGLLLNSLNIAQTTSLSVGFVLIAMGFLLLYIYLSVLTMFSSNFNSKNKRVDYIRLFKTFVENDDEVAGSSFVEGSTSSLKI
ncbi:MAG: hypothetical protein ACXQTE_06045 [Methanosarcinaceae archaeon]